MREKGLVPLVGIVLLTIVGLIATIVVGNQPLLGLDLQGGAAVVLQPTEETNEESLDQAISVIRNRVDGLGVAEPEISRQGQTVLVQLPGVDNQQTALDVVGQTAELRFRPVLSRVDLPAPIPYDEVLANAEERSAGGDDAPEDSAPEDGAPEDDAPQDDAPGGEGSETDGSSDSDDESDSDDSQESATDAEAGDEDESAETDDTVSDDTASDDEDANETGSDDGAPDDDNTGSNNGASDDTAVTEDADEDENADQSLRVFEGEGAAPVPPAPGEGALPAQDSDTTEPDDTEPDTTEPEDTEPDDSEPDSTEPDSTLLGPVVPTPTTITVDTTPPSTIALDDLSDEDLADLDFESLISITPEQNEELTEERSTIIQERFSELLEEQQAEQADAALNSITLPEDDEPEVTVTLPELDADRNVIRLYTLGPTLLTGEGVDTASAVVGDQLNWTISLEMKSGETGIDAFNAAARQCFQEDGQGNPAVCPATGSRNGALAFVLDGVVSSAPEIQTAEFQRDQIQISGDYDQESAQDLALVLRYGSLPVELEPQSVQSVSATLGADALNAGLIAGLVGLAIVAIYMLSFYRLLGLVAMGSLAVSAGLLWIIIAFLGSNQGLALTLAGVTGIIVSIGVSLDSNVVFFENLKEDVRNGRTLRSSIDSSFAAAFSTIVKADMASLIGAIILYLLTIGPVRGFAFYLGLATIIDLVASYYFMRPAVRILGSRPGLWDKPEAFGLGRAAATAREAS